MNLVRFLRRSALAGAVVVFPMLAACSSRPGGYDGYMTRSYTVRGQILSADERGRRAGFRGNRHLFVV